MNTLDEWTKTTTRSQISTLKCNHNITRRSAALQPPQPVPITNKFSVLAKLLDSTTRDDATASEGKRTTDGLTYNYKRMRNQKRQNVRNNINDHHGMITMQHPTVRTIPWREPKDLNNSEREPNVTSRNNPTNPRMSANSNTSVSDKVIREEHKTTQHILTKVNGEVIETINSKVELSNASNKGSTRNFMSDLIMELANKRNSHSSNKKHKLICIGDSHIRGFANMIKNLVSNNYEFYSVLKPGSSSSQLLETASQEIMKRNHDDILITCSGTNDLATNRTSLAFQNVSNLVTKNNHTNIILVNIPFRYDAANTSTVNDSIEKFNRRLEKLVKVSPRASFLKTEQSRKLCMRHGFHYNRLGKQYCFIK